MIDELSILMPSLFQMSVNETSRIKEKAKEQLEASRRLLEDQEVEIKV